MAISMRKRIRPFVFGGVALSMFCSGLLAQDVKVLLDRMNAMESKYESRIAELEREVVRLRTETEDPSAAARSHAVDRAIDVVGNTSPSELLDKSSRFSNAFNPAISLVSDLVLGASNRNDSYEASNQFRLRSIELGVLGKIDPQFSYVATFHWDENEVELEEAYVEWDTDLFDTFSLKAGRIPIDFGRASPVHDHELPFVDKPYAVQALLGGRALTTGVAVHHWFGIGETPVRWSLGIGNAFEGDAHAISGPSSYEPHHDDSEGAEPFGSRGLRDFVLTSRVTSVLELAPHDDVQAGISAIYAPRERHFAFADPPVNSIVTRHETDRLLVGVDLFYRHHDPSTNGSLTVGGEWIWARSEPVDVTTSPVTWLGGRKFSHGGYLMADYAFNENWSLGLRIDHILREGARHAHWTSGNVAITYNINEFNRVRLEGGLVDDDLINESYGFLMLQWTIILGSHTHALNW